MGHTISVWAIKLVEAIFFAGLLGCVLVVAISWVSVSRSGFGRKE
jgi:hypothetical protein